MTAMTDEKRVSDDKLREIIAGCEGVTPGPWKVYDGSSWRRIGTAPDLGRDYDDCAVLYPNKASDGHPDINAGRGQDTYANLNHIARLDPQTVAALCSELLARRSQEPDGWRPIETAPKDGSDLHLYGRGVREGEQYAKGQHIGFWSEDDNCWFTKDPTVVCLATHWRPLPAAPIPQSIEATKP